MGTVMDAAFVPEMNEFCFQMLLRDPVAISHSLSAIGYMYSRDKSLVPLLNKKAVCKISRVTSCYPVLSAS